MSLEALRGVKVLTFDVFGTVVDWRSSVEAALRDALASKLAASPPGDLQQRVRSLASSDEDWAATFAQEWRNSYKTFTRSFRAGETVWKDIDTHHHDSLVELLDRWGLGGGLLFTADEVRDLSLVWHRLTPWPDAAAGIRQLNNHLGLRTASLSNGNHALLADLERFGNLGFTKLLSAEDFGAYKPDPKVYLGAVETMGVQPHETAMVAAHLNDLDAARRLGLKTVYVERVQEEDWDQSEERYRDARGWVDLWIGVNQPGFLEVADRLDGLRCDGTV